MKRSRGYGGIRFDRQRVTLLMLVDEKIRG